jgi:hypothetical protein
MRTRRPVPGLVAALVAGGLILAPIIPAAAQTAADPADAAAPAAGDPPARVGRVARLSGTVSFHTANADKWEPATLNYPLTGGDAFWTEPQSSAALEIAASRFELAPSTELDFDQIDPASVAVTVAQGEIAMDVPSLQPGESYIVRTPRGTVTIATPGRYDIVAGDSATPTTISVIDGAADVAGTNLSLQVAAGQTATVTGDSTAGFAGTVGALARTAFLDTAFGGGPPAEAGTAAPPAPVATSDEPPPIVRQMPGGADLGTYGSWQDNAQYGRVWHPRVDPGWVPYRDGHWAFVAPWGWTWVDDAPWGFAPFHYGRWVQVDDRWAWAPVAVGVAAYPAPVFAEPVYAPALVGFFGVGEGFAVGAFGVGFGASIGWCPLGWNEPFHPWYGASRGYFRAVNRYSVTNITNVTINRTVINNFRNVSGATLAPARVFANSERVAPLAAPVSRAQWAQARTISAASLRPTGATAGMTPHLAQQLHLPVAAVAGRPAAAGPAIAARAGGLPALRAAAAGGAPHGAPGPGLAAAGGLPAGHGPSLPALRPAGSGSVPGPHGGAPGPAIAPRAQAGVAGPAGHWPPTSGFRAAPGAPGPAPGRNGAGFAGAPPGPRPLPALRSPGFSPGPARPGQPGGPSSVAAAPHAPGDAPPQPRYQPPVPHPHYEALAQPRLQPPAPQPRIQAPMPHAPMPASQPRVQVPPAPHFRAAPPPQFRAPAAQPQFHVPVAQPQFRAPAAQPRFHVPAAQPQFRAPPPHVQPLAQPRPAVQPPHPTPPPAQHGGGERRRGQA